MHRVRHLSCVIAIFSLLSSIASAEEWAKLDGRPEISGTKLPETSYVKVQTRPLARARLLYFNADYARELGIEVPAEGMTPAFEKMLLERFAWSVPDPKDPPGSYREGEKTFYASRYGGMGVGKNLGDGRSASTGGFSIKGIGRTPLSQDTQFGYNHGGASIKESIQEAVWGEMLHQRTGAANRVLCIIGSGTQTHWPDGGKEERALIVRKDFVRPAHFLPNSQNTSAKVDQDRLNAIATSLVENFNGAGKTTEQRVREGLFSFAREMGVIYGRMHGAGFYHGGTSPSNMTFPAGLADYGTATSQPGFGPIQVLNQNDPFLFELNEIERHVFEPLAKAAGLVGKVDPRTLTALFRNVHQQTFGRELLLLTGMPEKYVDEMLRHPEHTKAAQELFAQLRRVGTAAYEANYLVDRGMPDSTSVFDLRKLLVDMAEAASGGKESLEKVIRAHRGEKRIVDESVWTKLLKNYLHFYETGKELAEAEGIKADGFDGLVRRHARESNRLHPELYRADFANRQVGLVDHYLHTQDPRVIQDGVQRIIDGNTRPRERHGEAIESRISDRATGLTVEKRYRAKEGRTVGEVWLSIRNGRVHCNGKTWGTDEFTREARVVFVDENGQEVSVNPGSFTVSGDHVRLQIPADHLDQTRGVGVKSPGEERPVWSAVHLDSDRFDCVRGWLVTR